MHSFNHLEQNKHNQKSQQQHQILILTFSYFLNPIKSLSSKNPHLTSKNHHTPSKLPKTAYIYIYIYIDLQIPLLKLFKGKHGF